MRNWKLVIMAVILTVSMLVSTTSVFADEGIHTFLVGGVDMVQPQNTVMCEGVNIFKTNTSMGTAYFPLSEAYNPIPVGITYGQPIIIDDYIFVQSSTFITVINKNSGTVIGTYPVGSTINNSLFIIKNSTDSYQLLAVSGGKVQSINTAVNNGTVNFSKGWEYSLNGSQISTKSVTVSENSTDSVNMQYVNFATTDGKLIALNLNTGSLVNNGVISTGGVTDGNPPVVYYNDNNHLSNVAVPVNLPGKPFVQGSFMMNGVQQGSITLDKGSNYNGLSGTAGGNASLIYVTNSVKGGTRPVYLMEQDTGVVMGFDPESSEVLFRITKYSGNKIINFSIKGTNVITAFSNGKLISFDIMKAIETGMDNDDKGMVADTAINFEGMLNGNTTSGVTSFSVVDAEQDSFGNTKYSTYREVFVAADQSTDPSKPNLQMYYSDKYNYTTKAPIPVPYAFMVGGKASSGMYIPGGIISKLSFAGGVLVFVDGKGNLHGMTAAKSDNLALVNFSNDNTILEKGGTYQASVDICNFSGKNLDDVPFTFNLYDDKDNVVHTRTDKISFGSDGCTVYLKYTIPATFDSKLLKIKAEVNMDSTKVLNENNYEDNVQVIQYEVRDNTDLEVVSIDYPSYPANQRVAMMVGIKNNSDILLADPMVPVTLTINSNGTIASKTKAIAVPGSSGGIMHVLFTFTTPDADTSMTVMATVNGIGVYKELKTDNNSKTLSVKINKNGAINNYNTNSTANTWSNSVKTGQEQIEYTKIVPKSAN